MVVVLGVAVDKAAVAVVMMITIIIITTNNKYILHILGHIQITKTT
jgi:type IV secretory pathway VirB3-like protein